MKKLSEASSAGSAATSDSKAAEKAIEATAVRLLAGREHSTAELRRKLLHKGHLPEAVDAVIARLRDKKLVSDDRFVSAFIRHHAQRGQGPVRIRAELRQQGIADEMVDEYLQSAGLDWSSLARAVRVRKFGASLPRSMAERAKQGRFLQYRGFNSDQIRAAWQADAESQGSVTEADAGFDLDPDF
ncbi:MAG TPA: regulatory protein RecX [Steroidobacteraceae bacterium]